MDVNELMKKAWGSVEQAGIPEGLQGEAFKEAVAYLRAAEGQEGADGRKGAPEATTSARNRESRPANGVDRARLGGGKKTMRLRICLIATTSLRPLQGSRGLMRRC